MNEDGVDAQEKKIEAAGNGKTYLPAGEYTVKASKSGSESGQKLKLVERSGRRFGEPDPAPGVQYEIKK